ncbi:ISNCY family transposase [Haploplasma axanthum]|uniref:Integrase core domain n=1 Tax=Haploplasma axanthum TaxID=29552 RepID=A0A449BCK0_HAPAX|nr:ISNCY family transposase [Haploplasma axanthum]VEU80162.1 Integrase core domain [Haploplasma axanthum]VEU80622.1 Integrase core domain [Haploplasma axanthum]VEU80786.1 Integrase core domain [Haploplasma axanthum]
MRKVELKPMEQMKYETIKNLVTNNGNKLNAANKLGISLRQVNRLIIKYNEQGKEGFIHGNRKKSPHLIIKVEIKNKILNLYNNKYYNFNFKHFKEMLLENEKIKISYNSLYNLLDENLILSPKAERITKRKYRDRIQTKIDLNESLSIQEKNLIIDNNILDPKDNHARLPRKKYGGELLQMDASEHLWFGDKKTHLHAAIDDATGMLVGAYFDHQETLIGYYNVLKQTLENHGIPNEFLTDRRTIFDYKSLKNPKPEYSTLTQFGYACEQLGITLNVTSIPQAKGRIERLFGTLQSRLINELRINNIKTIVQANEFLQSYLDKFNKQFSLINDNIPQVYEKINSDTDLNLILAVISSRVFDRGSALKYQNKYFQAYNKNGNLMNFKHRTKAIVIKSFDNKLYCLINSDYYKLIELESHESHSKDFDLGVEKEKKKYTVPNSHPWKSDSYNRMIERAMYKSR